LKKVLIITYYWPPSGGSGVQRWMYFAKYLPEFGIDPFVLTVDPAFASYKFIDESFEKNIKKIRVYRTATSEPFNIYSKLIGKSKEEAIPQGFTGESNPGILRKMSRFVRGNFFIPDARKGWVKYAVKEAEKIIETEKIETIITTGPPHSSHLIGLKLKKKFKLKWIVDFRDPWTEVFYNKLFYRTKIANSIDHNLELRVLREADVILTIGPTMVEILRNKLLVKDSESKKVLYIFNGFDQEVFKNLKRNKTKDYFTICHLGILSDNQPIDGFINAMKMIYNSNKSEMNNIVLQLIGKISPGILNKLSSEIPSLQLKLRDYMPHDEAMQQIMNADLLFNSLAEVSNGKYLISGKLMEYIATGNPILCLGDQDGDASALLRQFEDAKVFDRKNVDGIYQYIQNIYNRWKSEERNSRLVLNERYSRYNTTGQLAELINKLNN
jgi:hypothetical protein